MLADALTKESPEALHLLRACLRSSQYQISPEARILELRAGERIRRQAFARKNAKHESRVEEQSRNGEKDGVVAINK